jgi:hypothetical protein
MWVYTAATREGVFEKRLHHPGDEPDDDV